MIWKSNVPSPTIHVIILTVDSNISLFPLKLSFLKPTTNLLSINRTVKKLIIRRIYFIIRTSQLFSKIYEMMIIMIKGES